MVTRDVPPYTIVAGNPAREIKRRFDDATVAALLEICWRDWPVEKIQANLELITGADIDALWAAV